MTRMRPPIIPEEPPPVVGEDALRKLLRVTEGRDLASRRDHALILLLADTGMRRAECGGLSVADLDLDDCIVQVCLPGRAEVDISKAPGLVSIGRGIGAVENLALAESLADKLGGTNLVVTPGS